MFERVFKLKANGVTVKSEMLAGLTTFMTMAYILAVNPQILGKAGMPSGGILIATALSSFLACVCMAFLANLPFALAPGMGLNAFFTYTVVLGMGYDWNMALFAVFTEGVIFIILSLTRVREAIFNAIPMTLKHAVGAGIGLFIAFIGLQSGHVVVSSPATLVTYVDFGHNIHQAGICAILALIGVLLIAIMQHKHVKGAILFGILLTWVLGILCQIVGIYVPLPDKDFFSLYPTFSWPDFKGFGSIVGQCFKLDNVNFNLLNYIGVVFAFLFVDMFDTIGTLIGVAGRANMLDKNGRLPAIKGALLADAIGTTAGAVLGTSTVTTYVESSSGVAAGGRTGLTGLTTGVLFLVSIVLSPIFVSVPGFATAPALIYVGFLMLSAILKVDFEDLTEALPAYICILVMPLFYSISEGISFGIISYVIINFVTGKENRKKISVLMYVLAILFIMKYVFIRNS